MMTNGTLQRLGAVAIALVAFSASHAAGPFVVRRAANGASLDASPSIATVASSPFDESVARSMDGSNYFYGVYDGAGSRLDVSLLALPVTGAIRLGFDDSDPASAPVGSATSSVDAAPPSIRADGVQSSTITIAPRDADGQLLGRGLVVTVDAGLLWPLRVTGAVEDLGDGTYRAQAVADTPGMGMVWVAVEGVTLASSPVVEALPVDPTSLRDLAILQLRDLTAPGGRFDDALAQPARQRALEALVTLANGDPLRDDNVLKTDLDAVLRDLEDAGAADLADDIVEIARLIALWHLDESAAACGVCDGSERPRRVCDAQEAFATADALRDAGTTDRSAIVDAYAWAVELALQAMQTC